MRLKSACCCLLAAAAIAVTAAAQEGHPVVGTWYGDWGPSPTERNQLTIVMSWDGKKISGTINPGPDAIAIKDATLDSGKWTLHIEADGKDKSGNPVPIVADGKLEDIGSYNRTLSGTWSQGATKGAFKIKRG